MYLVTFHHWLEVNKVLTSQSKWFVKYGPQIEQKMAGVWSVSVLQFLDLKLLLWPERIHIGFLSGDHDLCFSVVRHVGYPSQASRVM